MNPTTLSALLELRNRIRSLSAIAAKHTDIPALVGWKLSGYIAEAKLLESYAGPDADAELVRSIRSLARQVRNTERVLLSVR